MSVFSIRQEHLSHHKLIKRAQCCCHLTADVLPWNSICSSCLYDHYSKRMLIWVQKSKTVICINNCKSTKINHYFNVDDALPIAKSQINLLMQFSPLFANIGFLSFFSNDP